VRYAPNPTLLQLLSVRSNIPQGQVSGSSQLISVGGFSIDSHTAADLLSAHPLLLWRGN
jgi:hypothetical protein